MNRIFDKVMGILGKQKKLIKRTNYYFVRVCVSLGSNLDNIWNYCYMIIYLAHTKKNPENAIFFALLTIFQLIGEAEDNI